MLLRTNLEGLIGKTKCLASHKSACYVLLATKRDQWTSDWSREVTRYSVRAVSKELYGICSDARRTALGVGQLAADAEG